VDTISLGKISHALAAHLQKPGLMITTLSGAAASKVAEYTVLLMLASNHLPTIWQPEEAEWPGDRWERLKPTELRGSTVGIVGYSIGRQVARLLKTFRMEILAAKLDAKIHSTTDTAPGGDRKVT
jgi:phosphoglycerate dehydrogenase-like enzyme